MIHMISADGHDASTPGLLRIALESIITHQSGRCLITMSVADSANSELKWSFQTLHDFSTEEDIAGAIQASKRELADTFSKLALVLSKGQLPGLLSTPEASEA